MSQSTAARDTVLVYRHRLAPASEVTFLSRFYAGFERLSPVWLGYHLDAGAKQLTDDPLRLGRQGVLGPIDRALFRHLGTLPPIPDLRALRPRLLHAHFGRGGAIALPIARALRIPLVVSFLGADATKESHYRKRLIPRLYGRRLAALQREAALFICVSEFIRDKLLSRGFPAEKLEVIHHGTVIEDLPTAEPAVCDEPFVLFVGRFVEKKGATHLIEAMRILQSQGRGARLVLVGDGPLGPQLRERAKALDRVSFLGWLPNAEMHRWMRAGVAVCIPSLTASDGDSEGLPTVVFEAMAEAAPVVASRHAGIPEAIEHGRTGLLVPEADPIALSEALGALIGDPDLGARLGYAAREAALERFNAVRQSQRLEQALLRVAEEAER